VSVLDVSVLDVSVLDAPTPLVPEPGKKVAPKRARSRVPKSVAERAQDKYGERVLSGAELPSLRTVMTELKVGQPAAREARTHLESLTAVNGNGSVNHA